jgi:hypothetical protein
MLGGLTGWVSLSVFGIYLFFDSQVLTALSRGDDDTLPSRFDLLDLFLMVELLWKGEAFKVPGHVL